MKNRSQRKQLKEHMQMKKHQFATQIGMSVLQLDSQIEKTIHIWLSRKMFLLAKVIK